jgi:hypothetical protein
MRVLALRDFYFCLGWVSVFFFPINGAQHFEFKIALNFWVVLGLLDLSKPVYYHQINDESHVSS